MLCLKSVVQRKVIESPTFVTRIVVSNLRLKYHRGTSTDLSDHLTVCIVDSNLSHWLVTLWLKRIVLYRTYYDRIQMVVRYLVQPLEKFFRLYDFVITWGTVEYIILKLQ